MNIRNILKKNKQNGFHKPYLITDEEVSFAFRESFNLLGINLKYSFGEKKNKKITISSVNPASGKSTIACNIAISLANMGDKVILIDGDLRKAMLHNYLQVPNNVGLTDLICSDIALNDVIQPTSIEKLSIITSGPTSPNPVKLLLSDKFTRILDELSKHYDWIILDTPPINLVPDALVTAKISDGIALVVDKNNDKRTMIKKTIDSIAQTNVYFLGAILNKTVDHHKKYEKNEI